jgi:hypothetical protein
MSRETGVAHIPPHIEANLIAGVAGHEKRVVLNLASVSRMHTSEGKWRTYDDFVSDWEYVKSTFVKKETCFLCGKKDIREACHIRDIDAGTSIIVGNECVYKHIEIITDGLAGLTGDEKRDFLKAEMAKAKARFFAADFTKTYDMDKWNDVVSVISVQPKWRLEAVNMRYYKGSVRMIEKQGYITPNTKTSHWFEGQWAKWDGVVEDIVNFEKRRMERLDRRRAEATLIQNKRNEDATAFRVIAEQEFEAGVLTDSSMISRIEDHIRYAGLAAGWGWQGDVMESTYDAVMGRARGDTVSTVKVDEDTPVLIAIAAYLTSDKLTGWEKNFLRSIDEWVCSGKDLTANQNRVFLKIGKKVTG